MIKKNIGKRIHDEEVKFYFYPAGHFSALSGRAGPGCLFSQCLASFWFLIFYREENNNVF